MVALIAGRHRHYSSGAVSGQNVVGNPHGNFLSRKRMGSVGSGKFSRDGFHLALTLAFGFSHAFLHIGLHRFSTIIGGNFLYQIMFGSQDHKAYPEDGIGTGRKHIDVLRMIGQHESHHGTGRLSDPIALHVLNGILPIDFFQTFEQPIGIGRDAQAPLLHQPLLYGVAAALAEAVFYLVIG